jgi:hypothetical protein
MRDHRKIAPKPYFKPYPPNNEPLSKNKTDIKEDIEAIPIFQHIIHGGLGGPQDTNHATSAPTNDLTSAIPQQQYVGHKPPGGQQDQQYTNKNEANSKVTTNEQTVFLGLRQSSAAKGQLFVGSNYAHTLQYDRIPNYNPIVDIFIPRRGGGRGREPGFQKYSNRINDRAQTYSALHIKVRRAMVKLYIIKPLLDEGRKIIRWCKISYRWVCIQDNKDEELIDNLTEAIVQKMSDYLTNCRKRKKREQAKRAREGSNYVSLAY